MKANVESFLECSEKQETIIYKKDKEKNAAEPLNAIALEAQDSV